VDSVGLRSELLKRPAVISGYRACAQLSRCGRTCCTYIPSIPHGGPVWEWREHVASGFRNVGTTVRIAGRICCAACGESTTARPGQTERALGQLRGGETGGLPDCARTRCMISQLRWSRVRRDTRPLPSSPRLAIFGAWNGVRADRRSGQALSNLASRPERRSLRWGRSGFTKSSMTATA
jgi:hypothetical protein